MNYITTFAPIMIMALFAALLSWLGVHLLPALLVAFLVILGIIFVFKIIVG